ncbi:MAG TPA: PIG-L family deacetylase [Acidimicrobiales bacterium]
MSLIVDDEHLGTSEREWATSKCWDAMAHVGPLTARRIVIVSPHPDDEVFGAGGILLHAVERGIPVKIIAVTDGEGSHGFADASSSDQLARRRALETAEALRRLGWEKPLVHRLHIPDTRVSAHQDELLGAISTALRPGDWCVAPWRHDGHPDHDACGDVARIATQSVGVRLLSYLVWTWHWATPEDTNVPWASCRQLELTRRERARKRWASLAFASQLTPRDPHSQDQAVLPAPILRRFWRPSEVYIEEAQFANDVD